MPFEGTERTLSLHRGVGIHRWHGLDAMRRLFRHHRAMNHSRCRDYIVEGLECLLVEKSQNVSP